MNTSQLWFTFLFCQEEWKRFKISYSFLKGFFLFFFWSVSYLCILFSGGKMGFLKWKMLHAGCVSKSHTKKVLNVLLRVSWGWGQGGGGRGKGGFARPPDPCDTLVVKRVRKVGKEAGRKGKGERGWKRSQQRGVKSPSPPSHTPPPSLSPTSPSSCFPPSLLFVFVLRLLPSPP